MRKVHIINLKAIKWAVMEIIKQCREKNLEIETKLLVRESVNECLLFMNARDTQLINDIREIDKAIDDINAEYDDLTFTEQKYAAQEINELLQQKRDLLIKAGLMDKVKFKRKYG
jgi:hypothetical protein